MTSDWPGRLTPRGRSHRRGSAHSQTKVSSITMSIGVSKALSHVAPEDNSIRVIRVDTFFHYKYCRIATTLSHSPRNIQGIIHIQESHMRFSQSQNLIIHDTVQFHRGCLNLLETTRSPPWQPFKQFSYSQIGVFPPRHLSFFIQSNVILVIPKLFIFLNHLFHFWWNLQLWLDRKSGMFLGTSFHPTTMNTSPIFTLCFALQ